VDPGEKKSGSKRARGLGEVPKGKVTEEREGKSPWRYSGKTFFTAKKEEGSRKAILPLPWEKRGEHSQTPFGGGRPPNKIGPLQRRKRNRYQNMGRKGGRPLPASLEKGGGD